MGLGDPEAFRVVLRQKGTPCSVFAVKICRGNG